MTEEQIDPRSLKERAWSEVNAIDVALDRDEITEDEWHAAMADLVASAYLRESNPYAQAGHDGDAASWEASRGFIAEALDRSGTFLDVGCASGVMMESVARWAAAKNLDLEPHGLEVVQELAELARARLPQWKNRIYVGNIRSWSPPSERFDLVLLRPEYAPRRRRPEMLLHVLAHVLKPRGRLIVLVGTEERDARLTESGILPCGLQPTGMAEVDHPSDASFVRRLFWLDGPISFDQISA